MITNKKRIIRRRLIREYLDYQERVGRTHFNLDDIIYFVRMDEIERFGNSMHIYGTVI